MMIKLPAHSMTAAVGAPCAVSDTATRPTGQYRFQEGDP